MNEYLTILLLCLQVFYVSNDKSEEYFCIGGRQIDTMLKDNRCIKACKEHKYSEVELVMTASCKRK